jgi:hypothetical protein
VGGGWSAGAEKDRGWKGSRGCTRLLHSLPPSCPACCHPLPGLAIVGVGDAGGALLVAWVVGGAGCGAHVVGCRGGGGSAGRVKCAHALTQCECWDDTPAPTPLPAFPAPAARTDGGRRARRSGRRRVGGLDSDGARRGLHAPNVLEAARLLLLLDPGVHDLGALLCHRAADRGGLRG